MGAVLGFAFDRRVEGCFLMGGGFRLHLQGRGAGQNDRGENQPEFFHDNHFRTNAVWFIAQRQSPRLNWFRRGYNFSRARRADFVRGVLKPAEN